MSKKTVLWQTCWALIVFFKRLHSSKHTGYTCEVQWKPPLGGAHVHFKPHPCPLIESYRKYIVLHLECLHRNMESKLINHLHQQHQNDNSLYYPIISAVFAAVPLFNHSIRRWVIPPKYPRPIGELLSLIRSAWWEKTVPLFVCSYFL